MAAYTKDLTESGALSHNVLNLAGIILLEVFTLTDAAPTVKITGRTRAETATLTDTIVKGRTVGRTLTETASLTDTATKAAEIFRITGETATLTDSLTAEKGHVSQAYSTNPTETLTLSHNVLNLAGIILREIATASDAAVTTTHADHSLEKELTEALGLTDPQLGPGRVFSDGVTVTDTATRQIGLPLVETGTLTDSRQRDITRIRTESVTLTQWVSKTYNITNTATLADTVTFRRTAARTFTEELTLTDATPTFDRAGVRTFTESATLTDALVISPLTHGGGNAWSTGNLLESVALSDALTYSYPNKRITITDKLFLDWGQTYTDSATWHAAFPSAQTINFEGIAGYGQVVSYPSGVTINGVTFTNTGTFYVVDPAYAPQYYDWGSGAVGTAIYGTTTTVTLPTGTTAWGADFMVSPPLDGTSVVVTLSNGRQHIVATLGKPNRAFFGMVSDTPITSFTVYSTGQVILDNLTFDTTGAKLLAGGRIVLGREAGRELTESVTLSDTPSIGISQTVECVESLGLVDSSTRTASTPTATDVLIPFPIVTTSDYSSMVPISRIITRIRVRYDAESGGSSVRWSDGAIVNFINCGLETLAEATGFYERYVTIPVQQGRQYYDLRGFTPETVVSITSVWSSTRNDWLRPANLEQLGIDWELPIGTPQVWFARGIFWMGVYPRSEADSGFLRVYFQGVPSRLNHPQAVLGDLPNDFYPALEDYALYEMAGGDGNPKRALIHWASYMKREKALGDFLRRRIVGDRAGRFGGTVV